ncbi:TPA: hypothetical protein SL774_003684 [Pseudomonas aeruginosa]|uniref:hypothetical protein n=1 Tax=Pseudomonas aeruginosa TaxID=287 RepID=UPI001F20C25D|nr:hypothetical protein [Pseudomonas aeruginosa]MDG3887241.1 hypothetical protein [Pseudomonas aeruginosa]HEJ5787361.1 hypothetical protein [Pseudomonas aeruginosa]
MTTSKIQMDQIRSTSATVTGENIRAGSQKKSSLSQAEGLQGASPDATCTCPSGDGSLVHPCPAHPASVEQAGGDERTAFEAWMTWLMDHVYGRLPDFTLDDGSGAHYVNADVSYAWTAWQARAALAQPSPGQAEAERPEVVAWRYGFSGGIVSDKACLDEWKSGGEYQSLMTVAQHERIVGELRAVIAQLRQHKNDYMDAGQETYRALQNEIREREAEIARLDGLVSGRTAERDAALARVAELERGKVYVEARQCDECQHGGINDSATGVAACHECDWTGPEPEEDRCPGCQRENCMAAACPQCGARYVLVASEEIAAPVAQAQQLNDLDKQCRDDVARALGLRPSQERGFAWSYLLASIKSCVEASEDAAQAQHSVPEGYALIPTRETEAMHDAVMALLYKGVARTDTQKLLNAYIAAAPGKEGV